MLNVVLRNAAKIMKRKTIIFILTIIFMFSLGLGVVSGFAENAQATNIIKAELNLQDENIDWTTANQKDKIFYVASPFSSTLSSQKLNLRKGDRIKYCFYTPTPYAGMGGLEIQIYAKDALGKDHWINVSSLFKKEGICDENGMSAFLVDDTVAMLGNGWYERSFAFPDEIFQYQSVQIAHIFIAGAVNRAELATLKESNSSLVMYYKNLEIVSENTTTNIFNEYTGGAYFESWLSFNFDDNSVTANEYKGATYYFAIADKMSLSLTSDPNPISIKLNQPEVFFNVGTEYSLLDFIASQGVTVESVKYENGENCQISGDVFIPLEEGVYTVTYIAQDGDRKISFPCDIIAYAADTPVILNADMPEGKDGVAGQKYYLPTVYAYYQGEKNYATEISVVCDKTSIEVSSDGNGTYFIPIEKLSATYTVTYKAKDFTKSVDIKIIDYDYPVADFSAWIKNIEIGSEYVLPEISITDPSDGVIEDFEIEVYNSREEKIEITDGKIYPTVSGAYTVKVTCTDSDGNEKQYEHVFAVDEIADAVYSVKLKIGENDRASGKIKRFMATTQRIYTELIPIENGDKLVFDVYTETPMAGIGSFSGQLFEGGTSWPFIHTYYRSSDIKDTNGYSMVPTTDISEMLTDNNGDPVWYHREVPLTGELVGKYIAHFSPIIETSLACGEEITVLYRNVYLLRRGGTKIPILPGTRPLDVGVWETTGIQSAYFNATLDPTPVLLTQFLPDKAETGENVYIGKEVVFDYHKNKAISYDLKVLDANNNEIDVSVSKVEPYFNSKKSGVYTLRFTFLSDGKGYTLEHKVTLKDTIPPVITLGEYKSEVKKGSNFSIPTATISDAVTEQSQLAITVKVFLDSREVTVVDNVIQNASVGRYMIVYTCRDTDGNESVERIYIEAVEKSGCQSAITFNHLTFALAITFVAVITVLKKRATKLIK